MIEVFAIKLVEDNIFEAQKEELLGYLPNEGRGGLTLLSK